jgi:hypothetical protein
MAEPVEGIIIVRVMLQTWLLESFAEVTHVSHGATGFLAWISPTPYDKEQSTPDTTDYYDH